MKQLSLNLNDKKIFEEVTSVRQLKAAYKAVRRNRGVPGIDGISIEEYGKTLETNLRDLSESLREWRYRPRPVKRVRIPKPGTTKERILGIPCVADRIFQYSLKMSLDPIFDGKFSDSSYGFRPGRGQRDALQRAKEIVTSGKEWVIDLDLKTFFDTINHDRIIHLVKQEISDNRILRLIGITLRSGVIDKDMYIKSEEGAVQGSPLSPLLSNIILHELDLELERRGLEFCRYADDCNIFVKSEKAANRVKESITRFIENRLKLQVNHEKSKVSPSHLVKFLGMTIAMGKILISLKSMERAIQKVEELVPRRTHKALEAQIDRVNRWYQGWSGYYNLTETPSQLRQIEGRIRTRFRVQLIRNMKRRKYLARKLIEMGVNRKHAYGSTYSNDGIWQLAHTFAAHKAWSIKWFQTRGLLTVSNNKMPHWQPLEVYVKLT